MEADNDLGKERLEPRVDILDVPRVHGESSLGLAAEGDTDLIMEASEEALLAKIESVESPQGDDWQECKKCKYLLLLGHGHGKQARCERHRPATEEKRVLGHPLDGPLDHLEMLNPGCIHRSGVTASTVPPDLPSPSGPA